MPVVYCDLLVLAVESTLFVGSPAAPPPNTPAADMSRYDMLTCNHSLLYLMEKLDLAGDRSRKYS